MRTVFTKFMGMLALFLFGTMGAFAQMSGTYSIDPSGSGSTNYTSFAAAISALSSSGVNGAVTFEVASGTYTGQVSITSAISGASVSNTIKFKGKSGNRRDVVLTNTGTYTIYLVSADYITFEDLTVEHAGTYGLYLNSNADYNTFDNVRVSYVGSGTGYNIYNYRSEYNTFEDCYVEGGYMGIYCYGWSTSSRQKGTKLINTEFYKQTYYGIYTYYGEDMIMDGVTLDSFSGNYGLMNYYGVSNIMKNCKLITPNQTYYSYWAYNNYYGASSDTSHVYNNMWVTHSSSSYGLYAYQMNRNKWHNNSLSFIGSSYGAYMYYPTTCEFYNNNWYAAGSSYGMYMYQNGTLPAMDNNNLDWNGSYWGVLGTYAFASLAAQKTQYSALNPNSIDVDPEFEDANRDLRSFSTNLNNVGAAKTWLHKGKDIDGNTRPAPNDTKYDIGCNEFYLSPYDLDVKAITSPQSVNPFGNNTITGLFKNGGSATLTNQIVAYQYSVDSGKTWSSNIADTITSLDPGKTYSLDLTTTWNPNRAGDFRIHIRMATQVSNDPDAKDETFVDVCSGMAGSYTVGNRTGADFATLSDALAKLRCGLAGNVTFTLLGKNGGGQETYPSIQLNNIHGTSSAQLTIDGQHKDSVKISFTGSGFTGNIDLNNCSYMNFTNMTIDMNTGTTAGAHIYNGAHHNSITNCYINGNNSTSNVGVALSGGGPTSATVVNDNVVEGNFITGNYYGVTNYSSGGTPSASNGNVIKDNVIDAYYYYGIMNYYTYNTSFDGNRIINPRYQYNYPVYWYYNSHSKLNNNEIGDYYVYPILYYYENYYQNTDSSEMINNIVNGISSYTSTTYGYGVYMYYPYNVKIWHNTFVYDAQTPPSSATGTGVGGGIKAYYGYGYDIQNNIFYTPMAISGAAPMFLYNPYSINKIEGNNYYHPNGIIANINGNNLSSIAALQSALSGTNKVAYSEPIYFAGQKNYRLSTTKQNLRGTSIGVAEDIDGDSRCQFAPSIGADESGYPTPKTRAFFAVDDTVFINAATQFSNQAKKNDPLVHSWYIDGNYVGNTVDLEYRFSSTGSYAVRLVSEGCGGVDTFDKTVYVKIPSSAPVADFLASRRTVDVGQTVDFKNITTNGPDSFYWRVDSYFVTGQFGLKFKSHTFVNGTDSNSTDPSIEFSFPGSYTITLYAYNLRGSDSKVKTAHITVRKTDDFCGVSSFSSNYVGKLFDEGGVNGSYTANRQLCNFLLDACTDETELTFHEFNLATGSYLRIYDGKDNKGKPLHAYHPDFAQGLTGDMTQLSHFKTSLVAKSGEVYFEFTSGAATASGFEIEYEHNVVANPTAPSLSVTIPDTVCAGSPFTVVNNTTGLDLDHRWYMDTAAINWFNGADYIDVAPTHQYDYDGTYTVRYVAENCGGVDSMEYDIVVVKPTSAPTPDFSVDNSRPSVGDFVNFTNLSSGGKFPCISGYTWSISPATYTWADGSTKNSVNPSVAFSDTGCYNVSLTVSNSFGDSTITYNCVINAISICIPSVKITGTDVGISRVKIGNIDNSSNINADGYENFTSSASTTLEIGASYDITIERPTGFTNSMNRAVWVDYNQDGAFDNSELVASSSADNNQSWTGNFRIPSTATTGITRMRVGANLGSFKQYGCGPNQFGEFEDYRVVITRDQQAPVIFFNGAQDTTLEQCASWTDPGAYGIDNVNGTVTATAVSSSVDMSTPGTYTVVYEAKDASGNVGTGTRTVTVTADATNPVLTLSGNDVIDLEVFDTYTEPGFTATDNCDGNITANVVVTGSVNDSTLGISTLTYTITDKEGNQTVVTRTINVVDTEAPAVTLLGNAIDTVEIYTSYTEAGIDITDNYYTGLAYDVDGTVNLNKLGSYTLTYTATDGSGNVSQTLTRTVYVLDQTAPSITLAYGADTTVMVDVYSKYALEYADLDDNYSSESALRPTLTTGGTYVNAFGTGAATQLGDYVIEYTVTDESGNSTTVSRNIKVVDRVAPTLTFAANPVVLNRWQSFNPATDADATPTDNYYAEAELTVTVVSSDLDVTSAGVYKVEFKVEDPSGNVGNYVLDVFVKESTSSINETEISANIYPNPTKGLLNINIDLPKAERVTVVIYNSVGQVVMNVANATTQTINESINMSQLEAGVYNIAIFGETSKLVEQVILTK